MNNNNKFDAVQMMRDIREQLSEKYWKHPDILKKEMQAIKREIQFKNYKSSYKLVAALLTKSTCDKHCIAKNRVSE
ncbi:MAG: hypothetical protein WKG06_06810 [Segetibacter sp.]